MVDVCLDYVKEQNDRYSNYSALNCLFWYTVASICRDSKVLNFLHPDDLKKEFDFTLKDEPCDLQHLVDDSTKTLQYCVRTGHPRFFNQISQGTDQSPSTTYRNQVSTPYAWRATGWYRRRTQTCSPTRLRLSSFSWNAS